MKKKIVRRGIACFLVLLLILACIPAVTAGNGVYLKAVATPYKNNEKMIALTFDDGPGPYTAQLLDGLKERGAKASFFLLGYKAEKYAPVIRRMKDEGHLIGSHTWNHERIQWKSQKETAADLKRADDAIAAACGEVPRYFRPPHGAFFDFQLQSLNKFTIMWSYDTIDWKHKNADAVYENIMAGAKDGAVILMHDIHKTTVEGVLRAMDDLIKQGYALVRVDELLQRNGHDIEEGLAYAGCSYEKKPRVTHLPFVITIKHRPEPVPETETVSAKS